MGGHGIRVMVGWILIGLVGYGAVIGVLFLAQRNLIYLPPAVHPDRADFAADDFDIVAYQSADGLALMGWHRPAAPGLPTIVFLHGNAGHVGQSVFKVRPYLDQGYGAFLVGYRGYSGNPGRPTEQGLYADARAALAWLADQEVVDDQLILYGESLGSGVAVQMAVEHDIAGLVLEAPFSSVVDVAQSRYRIVPARWLVLDRYESAGKIAGIDAPLLLVHGERDFVIPIRFGRRLFAAAVDPKQAVYIPGAGHNDLYDHGMAELVLAFLGELQTADNPLPLPAGD